MKKKNTGNKCRNYKCAFLRRKDEQYHETQENRLPVGGRGAFRQKNQHASWMKKKLEAHIGNKSSRASVSMKKNSYIEPIMSSDAAIFFGIHILYSWTFLNTNLYKTTKMTHLAVAFGDLPRISGLPAHLSLFIDLLEFPLPSPLL